MAKILLIVAQDGFQTLEYHDPKQVLEEAGHTVITASVEVGKARSNVGEDISVDMALRDVKAGEYDAVFVCGGPGALKDLDNEDTARIMKEAKAKPGMPYGAICIAPRILAKAGVLVGLHVTGWDHDGKLQVVFKNSGAEYEVKPVVVDGRVITAEGPSAAIEFGEAIKQLLA